MGRFYDYKIVKIVKSYNDLTIRFSDFLTIRFGKNAILMISTISNRTRLNSSKLTARYFLQLFITLSPGQGKDSAIQRVPQREHATPGDFLRQTLQSI